MNRRLPHRAAQSFVWRFLFRIRRLCAWRSWSNGPGFFVFLDIRTLLAAVIARGILVLFDVGVGYFVWVRFMFGHMFLHFLSQRSWSTEVPSGPLGALWAMINHVVIAVAPLRSSADETGASFDSPSPAREHGWINGLVHELLVHGGRRGDNVRSEGAGADLGARATPACSAPPRPR